MPGAFSKGGAQHLRGITDNATSPQVAISDTRVIAEKTLEVVRASGNSLVSSETQAASGFAIVRMKTPSYNYEWNVNGATGLCQLYSQTAGATRVAVDASGNLLVGVTSGSTRLEVQGSSTQIVAQCRNSGGTGFLYTATSDQSVTAGESSTDAMLYVRKDTTSSRSINAAGTINASGADYAEYKRIIAALYGSVSKGSVLGYNADGLLTDRFADVSGRFVVKSTSPNLVGNDQWGSEAKICAEYGVDAPGDQPAFQAPEYTGAEPSPVDEEGNPTDPAQQTQYEADYADYLDAVAAAQAQHDTDHAAWVARKAVFNDALEQERVKWDRIAMCGLVPCNVTATAADIGKYMVAKDDGSGGIDADLVAEGDLTLTQYIKSFGIIEAIGDDGRPLVNVKIA